MFRTEALRYYALATLYDSHANLIQMDEILVACEGVPALFSLKLGGPSPSVTTLVLAGNALDVAFVERDQDTRVAIISIDHMHRPGSTTEIRDDQASSWIINKICQK